MKFRTILIIILFSSVTLQKIKSTKVQIQTEVENNAVFIEDIKKWMKTSYIIISYDGNIEENIFIYKLSRLLLVKGIQTMTLKFKNMHLLPYRIRVNRPLVIVYLSAIASLKEFEKLSKQVKMNWPVWVIVFKGRHESSLLNYCIKPPGNYFNLVFNSKVIIKCNEDKILREWYSVNGNQTEIRDLANWDLKNHLFNKSRERFYERFNIEGKKLRTVVLKSQEFPGIQDKLGLSKEVLDELGKIMNFTSIITSEENQFGTLENGKWSGIMHKLSSSEVDLAATEMSMSSKRLLFVDFTIPILESYKALYFRQPNGTEIRQFGYFQAFHKNVWIVLLLLLLIIPTCLTYMTFRIKKCRILPYSFVDNFLDIWRIYCQQGIISFPKKTSLRIVYFVTFILSSILLSAYSASLVSHLAVFSPKLPFSTLEEFINQESYKLIIIKRGETFDSIKNSNDRYSKLLRSILKKEEDLPLTFRQGFEMVCNHEHTAFMVEQTAERVIFQDTPCTLTKIPTFTKISLSISLPKDSAYTGIFNYYLRRFKEYGILSRIVRRNFQKQLVFQARKVEPITIRGIEHILQIIILGFALAAFILILEKSYFYYQERKVGRQEARNISED